MVYRQQVGQLHLGGIVQIKPRDIEDPLFEPNVELVLRLHELGERTQTYTQATPDVQPFLTNLSKLLGQVASQRLVSELLVLLHPRCAAWTQASGTASLSDVPALQ